MNSAHRHHCVRLVEATIEQREIIEGRLESLDSHLMGDGSRLVHSLLDSEDLRIFLTQNIAGTPVLEVEEFFPINTPCDQPYPSLPLSSLPYSLRYAPQSTTGKSSKAAR